MKEAHFLGVDFHIGSREDILARLRGLLDAPRNGSTIVMHGNLHTVYTSRRVAALKSALAHPRSMVLFEGIGLKIARFLTSLTCWPDNNGSDMVPLFLSQQPARPLRLALVGGQVGIADAAGQVISQRFANAVIVKTFNGYADLADTHSVLDSIIQARPDILLLGLGTPFQEVTATAFAKASGIPIIWCVGGLFDLFAGVKQRAPRAVLACRIEWLWRLVRHPLAYWRRTLVQGPWLLLQVLSTWASKGRSR